MANGNGTTKWVIGICASLIIAIAGWATTATLSARVKMMDNMTTSVEKLQTTASENRQKIMVLETQYQNINDRLTEIKVLLEKHVGH